MSTQLKIVILFAIVVASVNNIFVLSIQDSYNQEVIDEEYESSNSDIDDDDDFMFSSDKRSGTILESAFYIRVLLVGFSNDGQQQISLSANSLEESLTHSISSHRPSSGVEGTDKFQQLNAKFNIKFDVAKAPTSVLRDYESILGKNLKIASQHTVSIFEDVKTYDAEVTGEIEDYLDSVFEEEFINKPSSINFGNIDLDSLHGVIVLNPDKLNNAGQMLPKLHVPKASPFRYRYTYGGVGYTQSWIGKKKYLVIDLSAGPCSYGPIHANEGTVASSSFPRVSHYRHEFMSNTEYQSKTLPQYEIISSITSLIGSSVKHVFLPDISRETVYFAEKIIVPIIALRDHKRFNPLLLSDVKNDMGTESNNNNNNNINTNLNKIVHDIVEKTLLPDQELVIVDSLHDLNDHKQIFSALYSSIRTDTVYDLRGDKYIPTIHRYIDEDILLDTLRDAGDMLAEGLLRSAELYHIDPLIAAMENDEEQLDAEALTHVKSPNHNPISMKDTNEKTVKPETIPKLSMERMKEKNKNTRYDRKNNRQKIKGAKIIPVYLFSFGSQLTNGLDGLLFKDHTSVKTVGDCVIVLQSDISDPSIPFFADGSKVTLNVQNPTRHIVAGLVKTIGGLMEPYRFYSPKHKNILFDYKWAFGCTPFGPYSRLNCISDIYVQMSLRNEVISRLDSALKISRKAIQLVDAFARQYLFDYGHNNSWIDRTYHDNEETRIMRFNSPMAFDVVARLHESVQALVKQFGESSQLMWNSQFRDLHFKSVTILRSATAFHAYTIGELDLMRHEMSCCRVKYNVLKVDITLWDYFLMTDWIREYALLIAISCILFCCLHIFVFQRHNKKRRVNRPRPGRGYL
jgi:hypothetical protein